LPAPRRLEGAYTSLWFELFRLCRDLCRSVRTRSRSLAVRSYVARSHSLREQFVRGYLGDSFGLLSFAHGQALANQFHRPCLLGFVSQEIAHGCGLAVDVESRDPDIPSCRHRGTMRRTFCRSIASAETRR